MKRGVQQRCTRNSRCTWPLPQILSFSVRRDCALPARQSSRCITNARGSWPTSNRQAVSKYAASVMAIHTTSRGLSEVTENAALPCRRCCGFPCTSHLADVCCNFSPLYQAVGQPYLCSSRLQLVCFFSTWFGTSAGGACLSPRRSSFIWRVKPGTVQRWNWKVVALVLLPVSSGCHSGSSL